MSRIARAASRRRSKKGDSSREASEESNAELDADSSLAPDDTDSITLPSALQEPGLRARDSFDGPSTQPIKRRITPSAQPTALASLDERGYDGNESAASTYDGDVSSTNTTARRAAANTSQGHSAAHYNARAAGAARPSVATAYSSASTLSVDADAPLDSPAPPRSISDSNSPRSVASSPVAKAVAASKPPVHAPAPHGLLAKIPAAELQAKMLEAISGTGPDGQVRPYKINPPPVGRPIRIYADGVYDLFHYAHALQLRQAKLFFPQVHLLVGVVSDELVRQYKATPVLTSEERYESVRNCKWVDEVVEDAPWVIDGDFIARHQIDYVAHDEEPYVSAGSEDVYAYCKQQGRFIPTRRTAGVSTSELLERIVSGYREGDYDSKLLKLGRADLASTPAHSARGGSSRAGSPPHDT